MDVDKSVEATAEATECVEPGIGSLDEPSFHSQAAAVVGVADRKDGCDSEPTQQSAKRFGVVAAIALEPIGELAFGSGFAADGRHGHQNMERLRHLVDIGRSDSDVERDAVGVGQHVMFAAGLAAICGIWAGFFAAFGGLGESGVDESAFPIDLVGAVEFGQE